MKEKNQHILIAILCGIAAVGSVAMGDYGWTTLWFILLPINSFIGGIYKMNDGRNLYESRSP